MKNFLKCLEMTVCLLFAGCDDAEVTNGIPAVRPFALERYFGVWHEVARMPHPFEKDMEYVTAEYRRAPDGSVRVTNRGCRKGVKKEIHGFVRQRIPGTGELEVSFFRPFYGKYRIIALNADCSAALVSSGTKAYAWILVRDPAQAPNALREYLPLLRQWGFDCRKLVFPRLPAPEKAR